MRSSPDDLALAECSGLGDIASITLERALKLTGAPKGNVQFVQWGRSPTLEIVAERGFEDEFLNCFRSVSMLDPSACGRALVSRERVVIDDVLADEGFSTFRGVARRAGFRSVQSTPLVSSGGALYGVVSTHAEAPGRPDGRQLEALQSLALAAADAIARLRARRPTERPDSGDVAPVRA